jgi:hypothetical protein
VSFRDSEGIEHAVDLEARTLYEAVGLAIERFRRCEQRQLRSKRAARIRRGISGAGTQHRLTRNMFDAWLRRLGGSPRGTTVGHGTTWRSLANLVMGNSAGSLITRQIRFWWYRLLGFRPSLAPAFERYSRRAPNRITLPFWSEVIQMSAVTAVRANQHFWLPRQDTSKGIQGSQPLPS